MRQAKVKLKWKFIKWFANVFGPNPICLFKGHKAYSRAGYAKESNTFIPIIRTVCRRWHCRYEVQEWREIKK